MDELRKFEQRFYDRQIDRPDDERTEYERDKALVIHSAAFRRLQGKTQVMGVGEGDFHRTRLTHSIEAGQIGEGLVSMLCRRHQKDDEILPWLPPKSLIVTGCFAHDLGHPPYGHAGERALQSKMIGHGGFEGNAQTLRILTKLEKYYSLRGCNPTRRTILAVLKYPVSYADYDEGRYVAKPPKCFYQAEQPIVDWALEPFGEAERVRLGTRSDEDKPNCRSLDASIVECADDIAYAVHDLEDIVARRLVTETELRSRIRELPAIRDFIGSESKGIKRDEMVTHLFEDSYSRKEVIGRLVNQFVTEVRIDTDAEFSHPLLKYRLRLPDHLANLLEGLRRLTLDLVVERAEVQQLEVRGKRIVRALYEELVESPEKLIPKSAWNSLDPNDSRERRVSDYVSGMTDPFAERIYQRLFTPGFGSSRDEL